MKVWLLKRVVDHDINYDEVRGFVVTAPDEATARKIAAKHHLDEGTAIWKDPNKTSCVWFAQGAAVSQMILRDILSG